MWPNPQETNGKLYFLCSFNEVNIISDYEGKFAALAKFSKGRKSKRRMLGVIGFFLVISLIPHIILHRKFFTA